MQAGLNPYQIEQFIQDGFVRIEGAFSADDAQEARAILWQDLPGDPNDPATWTQSVVRPGMYGQAPFQRAANTAMLHQAFDQLVGLGRWVPRHNLGTFPVRFPSAEEPGDTGWHVDASFPGADPTHYLDWRVNVRSRGRALLMLFLFSDCTGQDAPTRLRIGSHRDVATLLHPAGEAGLSFMDLAGKLSELPDRTETVATGKAGTVYLCHPFLVHAAQAHHGTEPRFLAQPPLLLRDELTIGDPATGYTPVEAAIRLGLDDLG
ncbi:phytanoyl-CoA dioxygenase family protein [Fibrella arboris]|uniref:phytanoyl-CoA dioxygenase family protein n=1 Tax=Fibrella arboris TaxID=3242486 RepID=UPI0035204074